MSWDAVWEKIFQEREWGKYPDASLIRFVARNFYKRDRRNTRLLEVGCGPGANVWYMAREGFDVYGIDASPTALKKAKKRIEDEGLSAHFYLGDIVNLPFDDDFFDGVIDSECLCCNSERNLELILQNIQRVLKPHGFIYSQTFAEDMYIGRSQNSVGDLEYDNISDGPLQGEGFVRLMRREDIERVYSKFFQLLAIDKMRYTVGNGAMTIGEWAIIGTK